MADVTAHPARFDTDDTMQERRRALTVPPSTHTMEQRQVAEINSRIALAGVRLTPADLAVDHAPPSAHGVPLSRVVLEGSPSFPYVFGRFAHHGSDQADPGAARVPLHTSHLQALSKALSLHHHWGG